MRKTLFNDVAIRTVFLYMFLSFLFYGCGYIPLARKTILLPQTESVTISVSETEDGDYTSVSGEKPKIKFNHRNPRYFIKQEKVGFLSRTQEINPTATNKLRRLDFALMIPTSIMASIFTPIHFGVAPLQGFSPSLGQQIALFTTLGIGTAGWAAVIPTPSKLYPKKVELDPLIPITTKDTSQLFLATGKSRFDMGRRKIRVRDYEKRKNYENGYGYDSRDSIAKFEFIEDTDFTEDVTDLLYAAKYGIDTSEMKLSNTLIVDSWIKSVVFNIAHEELICDIKASWGLKTTDEIQFLYGASVRGESGWIQFNEALAEDGQQLIIKQVFLDALDKSFKQFLALDTVQKILSSPVPIPLEEEEELTLRAGTAFSQSVGACVKSVVTVVTNDGHGSGCVITPDGYIITNAHVVESDTTDLRIIMSDNVERKHPVKLVRMNEAIDLALLKLDTTGLTPLKLGKQKDIETGADVFAIGTPADIELGQTVTRGIISGKRKFGGHQVIQTDVAISPGNSGGALIGTDGMLLGIVTAEMRSREIDDIGFAIPSHLIESALKIRLAP